MITPGKGMYIWKLIELAGGVPSLIVDLVLEAGLTHVWVKIGDGVGRYNVSVDLPDIVRALQDAGVIVFGWHYLYGGAPEWEAARAITMIEETGVTGYVIDAEAEFKAAGMANKADRFVDILKLNLPADLHVGLSTYRFPSYHPQFPYQQFLRICDFVAPQVYWEQSHNPVEQLLRSFTEWQGLAPGLPYIPTGAAYTRGSWAVQPGEIAAFLDKARALGLQGANFWELNHVRKYLPAVYQAIVKYDWPVELDPGPEPDPGGDELAIEKAIDRNTDAVKAQTLAIQEQTEVLSEMLGKIGAGGDPGSGDPGGQDNRPRWRVDTTGKNNKRVKVRTTPNFSSAEVDYVEDGQVLISSGQETTSFVYIAEAETGEALAQPGWVEKQYLVRVS